MIVVKYSSDKKNQWDEFIKSSKNGLFMFYRDYMEYHSDRFIDNSLMFYENEKLISVFPASVSNKVLLSHGGLTFGGFVTDSSMKQHHMNDLFESLLNYSKQNDIQEIIYKQIPHIYHKIPAEEDLYSLFCINASINKIEAATVIDLQNRPKIPKGRKAQITRAKREGVIFEESYEFEKFINLENDVLGEYHNATAVHTGKELELLRNRFPEQIKLYVGKHGEDIVAGCLLFVYENLVHTQYLAANDWARENGALDLVIFTLIEKFKDNKKWFDFGKSTEGDGKILNKGLISQKEGFGGRTFVYQTWKISLSEIKSF